MGEYLVTQIPQVAKDAASDLVGATKATKLTSSGLVSFGKQLSAMNLLDGWFGKLAKRIVDTRIMLRVYEPAERKVMRTEQEYGAFIQRVYYTDTPDPTNNTAYEIPNSVTGKYEQTSPYDVEGSVAVQCMIYGGKGTWTLELVIPTIQIKEAFTSASAMDAFIAGIYLKVDNEFKLQEEGIANLAVNTGIANAFMAGLKRNILGEYNMKHDDNILTWDEAKEDAQFLKYASKEISRLIKNMGKMSTVFNKKSYKTHTSKDNMVVEILADFNSSTEVYLEADTYHNELVKLPNFEEVPYWQSIGSAEVPFEEASRIHIENADLAENVGDPIEFNQAGIFAFIHDIEYVAATFYDRRTWELPNPRDEVVIHGEKATKGYAIDNFMNAFVLYMENNGDISVSGDDNATLKYTHAYEGHENMITVSAGKVPSATDVTFTQVGETDTYKFTPTSNEAFTITVANAT